MNERREFEKQETEEAQTGVEKSIPGTETHFESKEHEVSPEIFYQQSKNMERAILGLRENGIQEINRINRESGLNKKEIEKVQQKTGILKSLKKIAYKFTYYVNKYERLFLEKTLSPFLIDDEMDKVLDFLTVPEKEARKILGIKEEGVGQFYAEEELKDFFKFPQKERLKKLKEFKEKLVNQEIWAGKLQDEIIGIIRNNPDISSEQLYEIVQNLDPKYILIDEQKEGVKKMFEEYAKRHKAVSEIRKEIPDSNELYKRLFNRQPEGKIGVIEGPMTLYFRCYNEKDYAQIYSQAFIGGRDITQEDINAANMSGGVSIGSSMIPELAGTIIAENSHGEEFDDKKKTYILAHEEQHAIKRLFQEENRGDLMVKAWKELSQEFETTSGKEEMREILMRRWLRAFRKEGEGRAKDEILAYFKGGTLPSDIYKILTKSEEDGGLYDYFANDKKIYPASFMSTIHKNESRDLESEEGREIVGVVRSVFEDEYKKMLVDGIAAFQSIRDEGFPLDQTMAIFIREPLAKWKKVAKRILELRSMDEKK